MKLLWEEAFFKLSETKGVGKCGQSHGKKSHRIYKCHLCAVRNLHIEFPSLYRKLMLYENGIITFSIMDYADDFTRFFELIFGKIRQEFQKLFTAIIAIKRVGGVVFGCLSADANG